MRNLPPLCAALGLMAMLAGCDEPYQDRSRETVEIPEVTVDATPAEDAAAPAVETAPEAPPVDASALPAEALTSEETVRPESETMFY